MSTRMIGAVAACAVLVLAEAAEAQHEGRTHRVGLLTIGTDPKSPSSLDPFFEAMRELNYVEGRNLAVIRGYGDGKFDRLPALIDEMVKGKVDVIVTSGTREVAGLKRASVATPIVMWFVDDPVAEGFVKTLAKPGGNVTGLTYLVPGLMQKYVELLREVVPAAAQFAVVHSPTLPRPHARKDFEAAARTLGTTISIANVSSPREYDSVLARAKQNGAAGIIAPIDGETLRQRHELARAALKHKLPGIYADRRFVDEGGLMSYSSPLSHRLRRAAVYVDKILRGTKPADLPVEQPTRFELVINMKTARELGVVIPRSLLVRADEVIDK